MSLESAIRTMLLAACLSTSTIGCGGSAGSDGDVDGDADGDVDGDADADGDAGSDGDTEGDPCLGTICDMPPEDSCADAGTVRQYRPDGVCEGGECRYDFVEVPCDAPPETRCEGDSLLDYPSTGACVDGACQYDERETDCGPGCCVDHCCEILPSSSDVVGALPLSRLDMEPPSGTFDTDADCSGLTIVGDCTRVDVPDAVDLCVCHVNTLTISGDLVITGRRGLVILASDSIFVDGTLVMGAASSTDGPGALGDGYASPASYRTGGSGGSFGTAGATNVGDAALVYGAEELVPLVGGMSGQDGSCGFAAGGGGGGAVQMTAGVLIEVAGVIAASGGGGSGGLGGSSCNGGAGGGSGGAILLEAMDVEITGTLAANGGGGGGGGGTGGSGYSGLGGSSGGGGGGGRDGCGCVLYGYTDGGDGGDGARAAYPPTSGQAWDWETRCLGDDCYVGEGGAGGGLGRLRINTLTGCRCGGVFSPPASLGWVELH